MSETLLGIIIGGAIGAVPSLSLAIIEVWKQRQQQKHELELKRLEMIEQPRLDAIREYARYAGAFLSDMLDDEFSTSRYLSAFERAIMFVSQETKEAMIKASPIILAGYLTYDRRNITTDDKMLSPEVQHLNSCLHREMNSNQFQIAKNPSRRCKYQPE